MNRRGLKVVTEVIFHCSASPYAHHHNKDVIDGWHKDRGMQPTPEGTYFGYHYGIAPDGRVDKGRLLHWYGQHCSGRNWQSIGICFYGMGGESITQEQYAAAEQIVIDLKKKIPTITKVAQHSDYDKRKPDCGGFKDSQVEYFNQLVNGYEKLGKRGI